MVVQPSKDDTKERRQMEERSEKGTCKIGDWLKMLTAKNKEIIENIYTRHRDRLMYNTWNKEK